MSAGSDGLNPGGPAQPNLDQVYETEGNPASKEPAQQQTAQQNSNDPSQATDKRTPQQQSSPDEATPSSLASGVHGAPPGEEAAGRTDEDVGRSNELEAEQLGTYGEDQIADSVKGTQAGAAGKEADMASDLDRKKAEQAPARKAVQEEQSKSFDVGGLLAQRGGPASTVD
ncbi:hypothetical protein LTR53_004643 [Teratosphaeriaceae sp. CCFEE 6253]|nr:hypothetical protein LTR53_004643 [Teratosphaeriaceae sp. CCFEE 6253]